MLFKYKGYNNHAVNHEGTIEAQSREIAIEELRKQGLFLWEIEPAEQLAPVKAEASTLFPPSKKTNVPAAQTDPEPQQEEPDPLETLSSEPDPQVKEAASVVEPPRPTPSPFWAKDPRAARMARNIETASTALRTLDAFMRETKKKPGLPRVGTKTWEVINNNFSLISSMIFAKAICDAYSLDVDERASNTQEERE